MKMAHHINGKTFLSRSEREYHDLRLEYDAVQHESVGESFDQMLEQDRKLSEIAAKMHQCKPRHDAIELCTEI